MRYRRKLMMDNIRMRASIFLAAACARHYIPMLMIHPRRNWQPQSPSCWSIPELRMILRLPNVRTITIDQCMMGHTTKRPTTILQISCSRFSTVITENYYNGCCSHHSHAADAGRTQTRDIPLELSRCIARAFHESWKERGYGRGTTVENIDQDLRQMHI
eukprot:1159441-Pyramimonas_sp.AAC.1